LALPFIGAKTFWSRSFFVEKEKASSNKKEEGKSAKHQCGDKTPQK